MEPPSNDAAGPEDPMDLGYDAMRIEDVVEAAA